MEDILKSKQLQKVPFDCKVQKILLHICQVHNFNKFSNWQVTCFDAKNGLLILGTEKKILWQRIQNDIWIEHSLLEVPLKALIHNHDDKICFSVALKSGKIGSNWFSTTKQKSKIEVYDLFDEEFEITALEYDQGQLFIGTKEGTVSVFNFKVRWKCFWRHVCHQWSIQPDPHLTSSDHYSHLKFALFCEILKSRNERSDAQTPRMKIVINTGLDCGSASWIKKSSF